MSGVTKKLMQAAGAGAGVQADEFFNQTTLLLHGDGTNGGQNNTFLDSSTNNFTITRNGNTTQGSFNPYGDRWSNFFDGTGDYLDFPSISLSSFTVEAWIYKANSAKGMILGISSTTNNQFSINASQFVEVYDGTTAFASTIPINLFEWSHVAASRSGSTLRFFVNGQLAGTHTTGASMSFDQIGLLLSGVDFFSGYMSDVRIIAGTAVYTAAFTPPTEPLTAISGTELLTCQSNGFKDNSANNFAITPNGDVKVTKFSPYAPTAAYSTAVDGGSGYFDGNRDFLSAPSSTDFAFGTGDFTIEHWVYGGSQPSAFPRTVAIGPTYADNSVGTNFDDNDNPSKFAFYARDLLNGRILVSTSNVNDSAWHHVAVTRESGVFRLFIDGVLEATNSSYIGSSVGTAAQPLAVGGVSNEISGEDFLGYIADVRIIKGTALYTAAFTPPTAPLTAVTNTSLLCNFTNAAIFDSTAKNVLETVGDAQIDTAVVKYGTGSMEFDGAGDILVIPITPDLQFGAGDFTIEGWINVPSIDATYRGIFSIGATVQVYARSGTVEIFFNNTDNTDGYIVAGTTGPASSIAINTWHHFAVVRSGTTFTIYVDGVAGTPATGVTAAIAVSATAPAVGAFTSAGTLPYTGYIDDFRITKGVARYTAAFTPPDRAFPDQ